MPTEFDDMYGGKWFKAADLEPKKTEWLPIRRVEKKQFDGEARPKYVLHFDAPWKPLNVKHDKRKYDRGGVGQRP